MSLSKEVDISSALDTAETRGASGDPIIRKLKITLHGKEKYDGSQEKAVQALTQRPRASENAWRKYPQSTVRHGTDE
jgi:hypothetical protein